MKDEKLEAEAWRIRRAIVETVRPLTARDAVKVLMFARKLAKDRVKRISQQKIVQMFDICIDNECRV